MNKTNAPTMEQINTLLDSNPDRSYNTRINQRQLLDIIAGLKLHAEVNAEALKQQPSHEPEFSHENGLDSVTEMIETLTEISIDPAHKNSIYYGLIV